MFARLFVISAVVTALAGAVMAAPPSFQEVEESLTCQCGCGLTVHSCNHLQCPSAIPLREEIREHINGGESKDDLLAAFANKYGEKILSAPTAEGFNLLAWTTPFVLLGIGGMFLAWTLRRWRARSSIEPPPVVTTADTSEHRAQLERELRDFDS